MNEKVDSVIENLDYLFFLFNDKSDAKKVSFVVDKITDIYTKIIENV